MMLVVLNNKCNFNLDEYLDYQNKLKNFNFKNDIVLCPSSVYLSNFELENIFLGSQNVSPFNDGAYTGEVSARQLKSLNVKYCLVGHSERRVYFKENNEIMKNKIDQLLENEIIPIYCVGELEKNSDNNELDKELKILKEIHNNEKIIIAYEPLWAIGTGIQPNINELEKIIKLIKEKFPNNKVLYGGSVNEDSIVNLKSELIDGYLLGGVSLHPDRISMLLSKLD